MNPYYIVGLIISIVALALQLAGFIYFFGFFRGSFSEFKESTSASLKRLEAVFFSDVRIVRRDAEFAAEKESQPVQRSKR